ncbi:translation initiation factor IF-2 N-terminal domain-containing protein [Fortiea contorta]|uniref:translation initiation factor IF-2 N-terminal domain-containing protein n=1 Tax=Fortiea contorta TaxID=1892405 RepID=UPI0003648825|nr:translation initiation factor IF-2 N-terminal domain-containing protein [Fortiea contorta]
MNNTKIRIYELSKQLNLDSKKILAICEQLNITAKSPSSTISQAEAEVIITVTQKTSTTSKNSAKKKTDVEDWGYGLINSSIDSLIRHLEGQSTLESYTDFQERRERAHELMFECVGKQACLFYISRQGAGKDPGEEIWELTIATDRDDSQLPIRLRKLGKTLGFKAAVQKNGKGGLKILSIQLLPLSKGSADAYRAAYRLRLCPNHQHHIDIPFKALTRIASMPVCGDNIPTEDQLKAWKAFLQIEENIAKARQFCVAYSGYKYVSKRQVILEINVTSATLDGSRENALEVKNFWERVQRAKNDDLKLFETAPVGKNWYNGRQLGSIIGIDSQRCLINLRLERELADYIATERYQLPNIGFLCFEAVGDIQQIQRKKKALEDLNNGRTQNPYLGNFLFDASQARPIKKTIQLQPKDLLLSAANPGQKAAVETVLAADDLVLIQGPPGTGKTTVIAEICYQIALRGGRTLIASQANLAVDNALSRLVHNPVIRAVRKGRAEKVGDEGQPFLEEKVIGTWLENTAHDCENNLQQRHGNIQLFRQLLALSPRFTDYLQVEEQFNQQQEEFQKTKIALETNFKNQEASYTDKLTHKKEIASLLTDFEHLLSPANINWESLEVKNFLPRLQTYTEGNNQVKAFLYNVRQAINYTEEVGLVRPECGAFGLAAWLQETVVTEIFVLKTALTDAETAAFAMSEVATLAQVFQQNATDLNQLQTNYQQLLTKQQSLQQTIRGWENRQREINYIIEAVTEWKSTAASELYQILSDCYKSGQPLTENMVQLPLGLLMFASKLKLSIVPKNYSLILPEWELLVKALSYEAEGGFSDRRGKQYNFSHFLQQNFSQIPIILSNSDRTQWQQIFQEFNNYQLLTQNQRKLLVENTQIFLVRIRQIYGKSWDNKNLNATLTRITQELLEHILTNARKCVAYIKTEAEQNLQHLQKQLNELDQSLITQQQISTAQTQVEKESQDANLKLGRVLEILQKIYQQPNIPDKLRTLTEKYLNKQSNIWEQPQEFSQKVQSWKSNLNQLELLIPSLDYLAMLAATKNSLNEHSENLTTEVEMIRVALNQIQTQIHELTQPLLSENLRAERNWLQELWQIIPVKFKPDMADTNLFNIDLLYKIKNQFETWKQELQKEDNYINRYENFVQDWIAKVRNPTESDRHDLRRIYLDNANVIGITCVQAANREFSEEFQSFDVVIIDEVSKCTPPELLIPALKGKKLVMVGDHRQLPPMLDTSTIEEVAQSLRSGRDEVQFLEESLFKKQFETADNSIKQMLTTQYRMHPFIMGAINQFYDGKLECGILEPDTKRAHNLAGDIIQQNHHLIWIKMSETIEFTEQREGTSFFNIPEIDVIENLCQQFENTWSSRVANGEPKKEIAVITFYGAQLRKIDERLQSELFPSLHIRTGTVDQFQGMERPIVIVSMVRNNHRGDVGFAKKPERVNVAFSRAQELLIIVGSHDLFTQQPGKVGKMYSQVSDIVNHHGGFIDVSRILC